MNGLLGLLLRSVLALSFFLIMAWGVLALFYQTGGLATWVLIAG